MRTTLKQTLAGAWMLLAALALSTAGCSQLEDTPDATNVATGNEPISISIAPKPSFEAGDADTRSTVDGSGNFAWAAGDKVYVILTFDDTPTATVREQLWVKATTATAGTPVAGWNVYTGWNADPITATALTDQTWPVGAKTCKVQAFHTNCGHTVDTDGSGLTSFTYADGQGDCMKFTSTFNVGDNLAIAFKHETTRITFTGLKANTKYRLKNDSKEMVLYNDFKKSAFHYYSASAQPFTTNPDGTFTRCMPLTSYIDASTGAVELTIYDTNGTTSISKGTLQAQGSTGSWKANGYRYTMKVSDFTGEINPSDRPSLLPPPPVQPGATVYEVNGYYVTLSPKIEAAGQWNANTAAIEMANDPCKGKGNWRTPTTKDIEAMAGWSKSNPWTDTTTPYAYKSVPAAFLAAFPANGTVSYWVSNGKIDENAWSVKVNGTDRTAKYELRSKTFLGRYRCVQPFDPNKQP